MYNRIAINPLTFKLFFIGVTMKKNLFKQVVVLLLVATMAMMSVGCYGSFNLTKKVYNWNGTMEGKWVKELVFLVLNIVPVYGIAGGVDAVILNSIEFWTGNNPMTSNITTQDGTNVTFNAEKKQIEVAYGDKKFILVQENGKSVVKDAEGNVLASAVSNADGSMSIVDAGGKVLSTYSNEEISSMIAAK
jgi:hypothetical protein